MKSKYRLLLFSALCAAAVYAAPAYAALTDGLVSYWPLNGNANDITPNANNLTVNGSVAYVTGTLGQQAAQFDGSTAYLSTTYTIANTSGWVDNGLPIYNAGYYTICMWVKSATATPPEKTTLLAEASTSSGNPLFQFRTDWTASDSFFSVLIENQNGNVYFGNESFGNLGKSTSTTKEPFDGTWHHVAWVDSNGVAALYVDGVQDPTVFINTRLPAPTNSVPGLVLDTFSLGATVKAAVSSYFAGEIQDVAIWERNLSETEISQVMAGNLPSTIPTAGPTIYVQPVGNVNLDTSINPTWAMQVYAGGTHPRTYQWYSNNVPLTDDGATIFGSQSNILNLVGMPAGYTGSFTVTVGNSYGPSVTSQAAQVTVSAVTP